MATMSVTADNSATGDVQALRPARSVRWTTPQPGAGTRAPSRHLLQAADATMRFTLALMPFSTLVWMFVAH